MVQKAQSNGISKEVIIKVTEKSDMLLEAAAAWSRKRKKEIVENLVKCPVCGNLLFERDRTEIWCPACGRRYKLVEL
jgi:rubrerythrin